MRRERAMIVAYFALWTLFELDSAEEPLSFRQTRLALHERLDQPAAEVPSEDELHSAPRLRLVRETGDSRAQA
jgi:hypothetical protein